MHLNQSRSLCKNCSYTAAAAIDPFYIVGVIISMSGNPLSLIPKLVWWKCQKNKRKDVLFTLLLINDIEGQLSKGKNVQTLHFLKTFFALDRSKRGS